MPAIAAMPKIPAQNLQNLPPLKGQRQGPISDPGFLQKGTKNHNHVNALSQQPEHTDLHTNDLDFAGDSQQEQQQMPMQAQYGNKNGGTGTQDQIIDIDFESGADEGQSPFGQNNQGSQEGIYDEGNSQVIQNNIDQYGEGVENDEEGVEGEEDEGESVYMIDGVVMRMIQIEGEENQYLMDPQGRIYDMQANFIGTANTQGLEEMGADGENQDNDDSIPI